MEYNVIFNLNEKEKLIISEKNINEICCSCSNETAIVSFIIDGYTYELGKINIASDLTSFVGSIEDALDGDLSFDKMMIQDIGYAWNRGAFFYYNRKGPRPYPELQCSKGIGYNTWPGDKQAILTASVYGSKLGMWLYNENDGSIILEIAPIYPWIYDPQQEKDFVEFQEFLNIYKPLLKKTIPVEIARQWLKQAISEHRKINDLINESPKGSN